MEKYVRVPVVDVDKDSLNEVWPGLLKAIYGATFIALDTELSGLGERKKLVSKSIEDRYKNLVDVAKSRAILAFGISCFEEHLDKGTCTSDNTSTKYKVHTFNLGVLCNQEFIVEPASLQFLIQHGFDFNKQFSKGISYHKGADKEPCDYTNCSVRNLFVHILLANKPVVLHNGLLDVVFLYHNFYCNIPDKLDVFTSDVYGMFSAGVLDTKYIAEYKLREPASYLSYIFRKSQRYNINSQDSSQKHITIEFPEETSTRRLVEHLCCHEQSKLESDETSSIQICDLYAAHGFCRRGADCHLSHNIDHILDKQDEKVISKKKRKNRKRKTDEGAECNIPSKKDTRSLSTEHKLHVPEHSDAMDKDVAKSSSELSMMSNVTTGGHRAGIDAFMTGYCLATYLVQCGCRSLSDSGWVNKISLSGKENPLTVACSHFSKPSISHTHKMDTIKAKLHYCENV